jgi:hypothetical protein
LDRGGGHGWGQAVSKSLKGNLSGMTVVGMMRVRELRGGAFTWP